MPGEWLDEKLVDSFSDGDWLGIARNLEGEGP